MFRKRTAESEEKPKRKKMSPAKKRQYVSMAGSIASTLSLPLAIIALANEKPGRKPDTDEMSERLTYMYKNNKIEYAERYSYAVKQMCVKYDVSVQKMNHMISSDPKIAREVYRTMDRKFNTDMKREMKKFAK